MSLLSKYSLRIILVVTAILIIGSISTVSYLTLSLDNNITVLEDSSETYHESDEQITDLIRALNTETERIIREELVQNVEVILGGDIQGIEANISLINAQINQIKTLLAEREADNYEIGGLNLGFLNTSVAGVSIPSFTDIIDMGAESASEVFLTLENRVESNSATSLASVLDELNSVRASFNTIVGLLSSDLSGFSVEMSFINGLLEDMRSKAVNLSNETEAVQVLDSIISISDLLEQLSDIYLSFAIQFQSDPVNFDPTTYETSISTLNQTLQGVLNDFQSFANLTLFTEIGTIQFELDGSLLPTLTNNLETVNSIQEDYVIILDQQDIIINNFRTDALNALNTTLYIVEEESEQFQARITNVINDMISRRQTLNSTVFVILDIFVFLSLAYVTWIITRGIGRLTTKNEQFSQGNLSMKLRQSYSGNEMGRLEESLDTTIREMRVIIASVTQTSETLAGISEELAAGAEEASASINEVSSTVREFSSGSSEQNIMLNRVRNELLTHLDVVESTANQIDETAKFVLQVAKRTNILGLNASIEAAKAGRFGLGFNVVAEEVRNLSDETRASAARIAGSIEQIEFNIRRTVEEILTEVNIIREVAENTAAGSEEASAATSEQVSMMNEISETSSQLSELSQTLNTILHRFTV